MENNKNGLSVSRGGPRVRRLWRRVSRGGANCKRIEQYAFILLTSLLLVLPLVKFNLKGIVSEDEKRTLALPPLLRRKNGKFNYHFFHDADKYLADRIGLKKEMVSLYALPDKYFSLISANRKVLFGKNKWLFYIRKDDGDGINDYFKTNMFTAEELKRAVMIISDRNKWCNDNGIKFIFFISPNKHNIYEEYYPFPRPKGKTRADVLVEELKKAGVDVLFPRDLLINSKKQYSVPIYKKTDTHWNSIAAMICSTLIMDEVHSLLPSATGEKFENIETDIDIKKTAGKGDLVNMLALSSYGNDYEVKISPRGGRWGNYYVYKKQLPFDIMETVNKNRALPKAVLYHDSFCTYLEPFLSAQFSTAEYNWRTFFPEEEEHILSKKPDIVIWEIVERSLWLLPLWW